MQKKVTRSHKIAPRFKKRRDIRPIILYIQVETVLWCRQGANAELKGEWLPDVASVEVLWACQHLGDLKVGRGVC